MNAKLNFVRFKERNESEIEKVNPPHTLIRFADGAADLTFVGIGCQVKEAAKEGAPIDNPRPLRKKRNSQTRFRLSDSHKTEAPVQELFARFLHAETSCV